MSQLNIEINYEEVKFSSTQAFLYMSKKLITSISKSLYYESVKLICNEHTIIYLELA